MSTKAQIPMEGGKLSHIEWRCEAIVQNCSHEFAKELQQKLNDASNAGFTLVQMMGREQDKGLVLVHQKAIVLVSSDGLADGALPLGAERLQ